MNIYGWILSGVFLLFSALVIFLGVLKGRKYTWMYSVARLIVLVLSVVCSVLVAKLISSLLSDVLFNVLANMGGEITELLNSLPSAHDVLSFLVTLILAPILFYPMFWIIRGLMTIGVKPLTSLFMLIARSIKKSKIAKKTAEETEAAAD